MTAAIKRSSGSAVRCVLVTVFLTAQPLNRLTAQVGHNPGTSPYHDIPVHQTIGVFFGHLSADRGRAGVGPSNASTFGLRYELPASRSLLFAFTVGYLKGDRFIVDPRADSTSAERRTGPFPSDLLITDVSMQLRLTGGKTWRGLAPYFGVGLGLVNDVHSPGDTTGTGYQFGTKITLGGGPGVRWYPAPRLVVTGDVRAQLWRLRYPISYHTPAPDGSRVVPLTQPLTDWTLHPWISLGVGWIF
jgi:hypothetical protein